MALSRRVNEVGSCPKLSRFHSRLLIAATLQGKDRQDKQTWPQGYKSSFMFNSAKHAIFAAHKFKMPTIVGILTFMSRKNSNLSLSEPKKMLHFLKCLYL